MRSTGEVEREGLMLALLPPELAEGVEQLECILTLLPPEVQVDAEGEAVQGE